MGSRSRDDDRSLAKAAAGGDREAAEALLVRHHDMVLRVCRRIIIDRGDAQDAAQEALVSIARGLPGYDGRAQVRTWMYRIAVNAALDELRRSRRRPIAADPHRTDAAATTPWKSFAGAPHVGGIDPHGATEDRDELDRILGAVPEEFRVVLALRYLLDMEYADIAETLELPVGTVRSRLSRGKELARSAQAGNPAGPDERPTHSDPSNPGPGGT